MTESLKVSVIIPFYNSAVLIQRCLDSVFTQNCSYNLEVICIDDGSNDNSIDIIKLYPRKVTLLSQTNKGPAAARNEGLNVATGKYLAFLDADDYWLPDFLPKAVGFLEKNLETIAVSVGQLHRRPHKADTVTPSGLISKPPMSPAAKILADFFTFWAKHNHISTGSVLMRTDVVKQTGGQRDDLRITEDLEFWAYLATFGNWGFIPEVLFVSDGGVVTKTIGWLEKNLIRWASAPPVSEWEERIIKRIEKPLTKGYLFARGRVAANLAYCMIISSRNKLARQTILENYKYLPKGNLTSLYKFASLTHISWITLCSILRYREFRRKI